MPRRPMTFSCNAIECARYICIRWLWQRRGTDWPRCPSYIRRRRCDVLPAGSGRKAPEWKVTRCARSARKSANPAGAWPLTSGLIARQRRYVAVRSTRYSALLLLLLMVVVVAISRRRHGGVGRCLWSLPATSSSAELHVYTAYRPCLL